ncbi:L-fucose mutarotase [Rhodospirillum sp. A1_3_36]|uniref:L-fucose mutarotase n=1 Tax=Rhodospirillum sp. A1_3_36 TaxID=3391666 RepID=UPI0039A6D3CE
MLKGISPLIGPDLLRTLSAMGHGDEILIADAHFPGESNARLFHRADGVMVADLLDAILPLFELDAYVDAPVTMIHPVEGDSMDPAVLTAFRAAIDRHAPGTPEIAFIPRFDFYDRARACFAITQTSDVSKYGCVILKKGVTPC